MVSSILASGRTNNITTSANEHYTNADNYCYHDYMCSKVAEPPKIKSHIPFYRRNEKRPYDVKLRKSQ